MPDRYIKSLDSNRGAYLLVGGIAYFFIGLSYVIVPTPGRQAAFTWLPEFITPGTLGILWVAAGAAVTFLALISKRCVGGQKWAFSLMVLCPSLWVVIFTGATITGVHPYGWVSAVAYAAMASWSLVAAGWDNPRQPPAAITGELNRVE